CELNNQFIANFEECEDNTRTTFSLGLRYKNKVGPALSWRLVESNNCMDSSLKVSKDIRKFLEIVKDNSCMGSKVSEVNTRFTFGLVLELEGGIDSEVSEDNSGLVLGLKLGLAKDKSGLGLEVKKNSKDLVKSNGS
ncbi:19408_t:CDS:2, partial [Racocetra persica]